MKTGVVMTFLISNIRALTPSWAPEDLTRGLGFPLFVQRVCDTISL